MGKFYSYPGKKMNDNTRISAPSVAELASRNPNFAAYRARRDAGEYGKSIGDVGELCQNDGEPAKVLHEEYDSHNHEVIQTLQRSQAVGSGTVEVTWANESTTKMRAVRSRSIKS